VGTLITALPRLLGGKVRIFVTRHVGQELRNLKHGKSAALARTFDLAKTPEDLDSDASPADAILRLVGTNNPEHFFVATQDKRLKRALKAIPGTPLIAATVNGLVLDEPPTKAAAGAEKPAKAARDQARGDGAVSEKERKRLSAVRPDLADAVKRKTSGTPAHKKRAKAPNPLAVKKKGKKEKGGGDNDGEESKRARKAPSKRREARKQMAAAAST